MPVKRADRSSRREAGFSRLSSTLTALVLEGINCPAGTAPARPATCNAPLHGCLDCHPKALVRHGRFVFPHLASSSHQHRLVAVLPNKLAKGRVRKHHLGAAEQQRKAGGCCFACRMRGATASVAKHSMMHAAPSPCVAQRQLGAYEGSLARQAEQAVAMQTCDSSTATPSHSDS